MPVSLSGLETPGALDDWFDEVHRSGPVQRADDAWWVVSGHAAAREVLRDTRFASGPIGARYREALPEGAARTEMGYRINFMDPPDHTRLRRLALAAFTPRRIAELRPHVRDIVRAALDELEADSDGPLDLLGFAHEVPSLVISELLGVPVASRAEMTSLSDAVAPLLSVTATAAQVGPAIEAAERQHALLETWIEDRRSAPTDDLLTAFVQARDGADTLSASELRSLAATLYSAGHRTTRDAFANGVALLGSGLPLAAEPGTVAEVLRVATPTQYVARVASTSTELHGARIEPGDIVLVLLGAANRDPTTFDDPHRFDPGRREDPPALSFAPGPHLCLGAHLARMELEEMFAAVTARWPAMRLAEPVVFEQRGPFRGPVRLLVEV